MGLLFYLRSKGVLKTLMVFEVVQVSPNLIQEAVDCSILNELSFWDALILAAASAVWKDGRATPPRPLHIRSRTCRRAG